LDLEANYAIASNEPALRITQRGHPLLENYVREMSSGLTEYMLGVHIVCLAARVCLEGYDLVAPWPDSQVFWLPDPEESGPDKMNYVMPESRDACPAEQVINHYIGRELRRGQRIRGWILASSTTLLPDNIKHHSFVGVKFGVVDQYDQVHSEDFTLHVDRSHGPKAQRTTKDRFERPLMEVAEVRQPPSAGRARVGGMANRGYSDSSR
jgi:hypothetical protein